MEYSVKTGDTIAAVTRLMGVSFSQLKKTNPDAFGRAQNGHWFLRDGSRLVAGDTAQSVPSPAPEANLSNPIVQTSDLTEYKVQTGETIKSVTDRFGLSFKSLKDSNPGAFGRTSDGRWFLYAGARIKVPQQFANAMSEAASKAAQPLSSNPEPQSPAVTPTAPTSLAPLPAPALDNSPPAPRASLPHTHVATHDPGPSPVSDTRGVDSKVEQDASLDPEHSRQVAASSVSDCPFVAKNLMGFKFDF